MHHPSVLPLLSSILVLLSASTPSAAQGTMCRNQPPYTNCVSSVIATVTLPCEAHTSTDVAFATACKCSTLSQIFDCYTSICPPDNLNDVFTTQFNSYGCPNAPPLKTGGGGGGGAKTTSSVKTTAAVTGEISRYLGLGGYEPVT
ncbi:hypothetical protein B0T16DRAFT_503227 [Cercophora newfieldiana]|uniref:Extracellular membrane protein CFEM domain-containing protein n=1 Tax=Cercophora newfieldiana TaxID=92897 RepID=A0AA39YEK0_9PEZI|nr:hypothetical protein B0T16DRAFT_503227 [Cercophora newfieldiana]